MHSKDQWLKNYLIIVILNNLKFDLGFEAKVSLHLIESMVAQGQN